MEILAEGKTKIIFQDPDNTNLVIIRSKDDITKNDDPDQTRIMEGKAVHSTTTTCAVFSLLQKAKIPVAFDFRRSKTEFVAPKCRMMPLEVIGRRFAVGSILKRYPELEREGTPLRFHVPVFELFLKTTNQEVHSFAGEKIGNVSVDDPLIWNAENSVWQLMHPKKPSDVGLLRDCVIGRDDIIPKHISVDDIKHLTLDTFRTLEEAWAKLDCRLVDFKIELGVDSDGKLLVADVIDNDSWRLRTNEWEELSKQLFRDNVDLNEVSDKYALVAKLAERLPD